MLIKEEQERVFLPHVTNGFIESLATSINFSIRKELRMDSSRKL